MSRIHHRHYCLGFQSSPQCQALLKVNWLVRVALELVVLFAHHRNHTPNETDAKCGRHHTYLCTPHYSNCIFDIQRNGGVSRHLKQDTMGETTARLNHLLMEGMLED